MRINILSVSFIFSFFIFSTETLTAQCTPASSGCSSLTRISNVTFGSINNSSTCTFGGFINYTATVAPANVGKGVMYDISVTCDYGSSSPTNFAVWIDYNRNSVFEATEFKNLGTVEGSTIKTIINTIYIDPNATGGLTKMRVRAKNLYLTTNFTATQACSTITYGETEDYTINIVTLPTCTGTPLGGTTIASANTVCSNTNFLLTVNGSTENVAGLTYQWQSSADANNWADIAGATTTRLTTSQISANYYRRKITCSNTQFNYSTVMQINLNSFIQCYCIPDSTSCGAFLYTGIDSVSFSNIQNASSCAARGYADYTSTVAAAAITAGTYAPITITFNRNNTTGTKYVDVAIDFNQNGLFDINEVSEIGGGILNLKSFIRIPFEALPGNTRMRIRVSTESSGNGMCNRLSTGETEDYLVNITPATGNATHFSFYVNALATGNGSGLSWVNAFTTFTSALHTAYPLDTIRIAKGTYVPVPTGGINYFSIKDSLEVMGGYPNTGNPTDALRNWAANQTILSNAGSLVTIYGGSGFTLDGFIIQGVSFNQNDGGALRIYNGILPKIKHCVFRNNQSTSFTGSGVALRITNSSPIFSDCIFTNNNNSQSGCAILNELNSNVVFNNCIFSKNNSKASIIETNQSNTTFTNCNFVNNRTNNSRTIAVLNNATVDIRNSIFFGNEKQIMNTPAGGFSTDSSEIEITNSTVTVNATITQVFDYGNRPMLSINPKFKDTSSIAGADNLFFTVDDGLQLNNPCSPCINRGTNIFLTGITKDILGNNRLFGSIVDIGAYELQSSQLNIPTTLYVNKNATGDGSGTSWANAMTALSTAMQWCSDTVRVATGTYFPSDNNQKQAIWLENKRVLLGGYPNIGNPTDAQRNPTNFVTIISGEIPNGNGGNAEVILKGRTVDSTAVTDGFVIRKSIVPIANQTGAIYLINNCNPVFKNCTISENTNVANGAGLVNVNNGNPSFENCIFENNVLTNIGEGGAVANLNSNPIFRKCIFRYNSTYIASVTPSSGGAVYNKNANPIFDSCLFFKNQANNWGGAMDNVNSNPIIRNCEFVGNMVAPDLSGGNANDINNNQSSPKVFNTIFLDSSGRNYGGSIVNLNQSNPSFTNCTFNNCYAIYGGICFNDNSSPVFTACVLKNSIAGSGNIYNQNYSNPVFINCVATGLLSNNGSFMYNIKSNPVIKNTTIANNSGYQGTFQGPVFINADSTRLTITNSIIWNNKISNTGEIIDPSNTSTPTIINNSITQTFGAMGANGNLVGVDPLFTNMENAAGADNIFFTLDDGLNLTTCSPAINSGLNAYITSYNTDILGNARVYNSLVDMGAYEVQALPGLVTNTWVGTINSNWENPFNWSLGILPNACTKVVINAGNLTLSSNATIYNITINPTASITIVSGFNLLVLH